MTLPTHNADGNTLRIYESCDPPHVENCRACFGWGVYDRDGKAYPLSGSALDDPALVAIAQRCPECGGTPTGRTEEHPKS